MINEINAMRKKYGDAAVKQAVKQAFMHGPEIEKPKLAVPKAPPKAKETVEDK